MIQTIMINIVNHKDQRYNTVGDWQFKDDNNLSIIVSNLENDKYNFLIVIHEIIEAILCRFEGITEQKVDEFDMSWKEHDDLLEPGDDREAPYHDQHTIALVLEKYLATALQINENDYEERIERVSKTYGEEMQDK